SLLLTRLVASLLVGWGLSALLCLLLLALLRLSPLLPRLLIGLLLVLLCLLLLTNLLIGLSLVLLCLLGLLLTGLLLVLLRLLCYLLLTGLLIGLLPLPLLHLLCGLLLTGLVACLLLVLLRWWCSLLLTLNFRLSHRLTLAVSGLPVVCRTGYYHLIVGCWRSGNGSQPRSIGMVYRRDTCGASVRYCLLRISLPIGFRINHPRRVCVGRPL